jgi:hypothetical protein
MATNGDRTEVIELSIIPQIEFNRKPLLSDILIGLLELDFMSMVA